ncbi:MAG: tetratricopeptide repeat protein [Anaerolineae bacterium]|jgi:signal transduction histidine kinase|nr:tetratricopeptide repeat protein [Anaerolineae bacterium]
MINQDFIESLIQQSWDLRLNDPKHSEKLSLQAKRLAETATPPNFRGITLSLRNLASICQRTARYETALGHVNVALDLFNAEYGFKHLAELYHIKGSIYCDIGNYDEALHYYLGALQVGQENNDSEQIGDAVNALGIVYEQQGELHKARESFLECLQIYQRIQNVRGEADALDNLGIIQRRTGSHDEALRYGQNSLKLYREIHNVQGELDALKNIGEVYAELSEFSQAHRYFSQALKIARQINNQHRTQHILTNIGQLMIAEGNCQEALQSLQEALKIAEQINTNSGLFRVHRTLAEAYEQNGDFEQALKHHKLFYEYRTRVFNETSDQRLKTWQAVYEVEKAKYQAEIYQLKTVELQREIEQRELLISDLDAYAHTVAHDLKNPLSVVINYARLALETEQDLNFMTKEALSEILTNSNKMAEIIDALLMFARLREAAPQIKRLDMSMLLLEVQMRLFTMIQEYQAVIEVAPFMPMSMGQESWIEQVWVNYLTNAIKYGGRPPYVTVGADKPSDGFVRYWVRDNGTSLTPQDAQQLFQPFKRLHRKERGHGLGLSIVKRIVERLGGKVGVEVLPNGGGSLFYFTLPVTTT